MGIIGGGPGGYVCAIRAAQLGLKVTVIEEKTLGGTCLNVGCIPTKALFSATKLLSQTAEAKQIGLTYAPPAIDLGKLAAWKGQVVATLVGGIETLLEKNGVDVIHARGTLASEGHIALSDGSSLEAEHIVLATGSDPVQIPPFPFDHPSIWSSDDALELPEVPERLAIIGGGVIGLELATIYNRLGSHVIVVELLPEILSTVDLDRRTISTLKRALTKNGIDVLTNTAAESFEQNETGVLLRTQDGEEHVVDRILVAVGRRPRTRDLGLESCGVELDERGFVRVDDKLQTTAPNIYAIGDAVPGPMLAHKASMDGVRVAETLAGQPHVLNYDLIPQAIFTDPEIASVGLSESRAKASGSEILVGRFPFAALGKALGMREADGFFQVVANADDHRILGVQIIGAEASDLISEAAIAVQSGLTLEAIAETIHPHPTLPEGLKEAAENALGRAIHTVNR
ncbi:dihydrolipoyl dehydrogenase [Candidatus Bipolaricaulota bacterium]|nr:dihydrolipoyl dehydrogenase [Candidatus Bipolaricaulota bacterium]